MVISSISDKSVASLHELISQGLGILDCVLRVREVLWGDHIIESSCHSSNSVVVRSALESREDRVVNGLAMLRLADDEASSWPSQLLVSSRSHNICIFEWIGQDSSSHET